MTREEIIKEAAADHRDIVCCGFYDPMADAQEKSFIEGAEWADRNPKFSKQEFIEKVRNWLEKHAYDDKYWTSDGEDLFLGNLIDELVKYLEE